MAVRGQKTKLKIKKSPRVVIKSNEGTPVGGTKRSGKINTYPGLPPIGSSIPPKRTKVLSTRSTPIGGSKKVFALKGPKKVRRTR